MAYNLYQVQMARAWAQRIDKENAVAEKFWTDQAMKSTQQLGNMGQLDAATVAPSRASSACPSGYTSKTTYLKDRLEKLETELHYEREHRKRVEGDLLQIKTGLISTKPGPAAKH
mmetsp:Transcript_9199/g.16159  ORF Transcript_9199/g.16159 Transcript_9199/m.16159 type:complete len:115 (+) Transcript_9199:148-492(+)